YSINDHWQNHSRLYLEALNRDLPARLLEIPWQKTGFAPKQIKWNVFLQSLKWPVIHQSIKNSCGQSRHFINYVAFDQELNQWIKYFQNDIRHLGLDYPLNNRERKQRMLSLVVALRMWSKNHWDVL
ncbi:MAG TPA: hypothetical protein VFX48_09760, partial [Saprospiraceae bacterium]|nr:hypothetical protein [Saprospiraceae bacterium]